MHRIPIMGFSEPLSSLSHLIMALFFLIAGIYMIYKGRGNTLRVACLSIYTFCLVFLFSMSGVYHLLSKGTDANYVLQILDHAGIYLMIAGSFTPYHAILLRGVSRWLPLVMIWLLAIVGLTLTSVFFQDMPEWLLLSFFITMGWMSLFTLYKIKQVDTKVTLLIFFGGVIYTIGAVIDFTRWPVLINGVWEAHESFHLFVALASILHWWAVFSIADKPMSMKLMVLITEFPEKFKAKFLSEQAIFNGKSVDDIQKQVVAWINTRFYPDLKPKKVRFRYHKEEYIYFEISSNTVSKD